MLYSLVNVNERFDRLALDPLHVHHLNFTIETLDTSSHSTYANILRKICENILPRINDKVIEHTVVPFSLEHVFGNVAYPQLRSLSLVNFQRGELVHYFSG